MIDEMLPCQPGRFPRDRYLLVYLEGEWPERGEMSVRIGHCAYNMRTMDVEEASALTNPPDEGSRLAAARVEILRLQKEVERLKPNPADPLIPRSMAVGLLMCWTDKLNALASREAIEDWMAGGWNL